MTETCGTCRHYTPKKVGQPESTSAMKGYDGECFHPCLSRAPKKKGVSWGMITSSTFKACSWWGQKGD